MVEDKCKGIFPRDSEQEAYEDTMEKCWSPKNKTDSRPFLIRDATFRSSLPPDPKCSVSHSCYRPPVIEERPTLGIRKCQLLKKFQKEAEAEVAEERRPKTPKGDYCTVYDREYQVEGYEPDDKFYMKGDDLYRKYPLYAAPLPPTTFATFRLQQNSFDRPQGVTVVTQINAPFKKSSGFSKPIREKLDNREW